MSEYIQNFGIMLLEILCCNIFFGIFIHYKKERKLLRQLLFWITLSFFAATIVFFLNKFPFIEHTCIIVVIAWMSKQHWGQNCIRIGVLTVIFYSLVLVTEYLTITLRNDIVVITDTQSSMVQFLLLILAKAFLLLFVILIKILFYDQGFDDLSDTGWLQFLFFPLFSICILTALMSDLYPAAYKSQKLLSWMLAAGMVAMEFFLFYFMQNTAKKENKIHESNLFHNAIDACQKCTGKKEKRMIKVKMELDQRELIISVQNTYDGNLLLQDGEYLTTKQDRANHGLGIKNMIQVIGKYDGIYSIRHTGTEFYVSIILPQETCG